MNNHDRMQQEHFDTIFRGMTNTAENKQLDEYVELVYRGTERIFKAIEEGEQ